MSVVEHRLPAPLFAGTATPMSIAIIGAGIAGTTAAFWLRRYGHNVTMIESAPRLRPGGYIIDFWGAGYDVGEVRLVNERGRRVGGFPIDGLRQMTHGRFTSVPRSTLARLIFEAVKGQIHAVFGAHVVALTEDRTGVTVTLDSGVSRRFDLVIGADGVHSAVRRLVFGPDTRFEVDLGYRVAAFEVAGYRPRDELVYVSYGRPGVMISRFAMRRDRTMFLMVCSADQLHDARADGKTLLPQALAHMLGNAGWECPEILAAMRRADNIYVDGVSQITMNRWSAGRVLLIGDAAAAVSLLAGEGAGLAMTEAYIVAGEIDQANGDYACAFNNHERLLRPFVEHKQASARRFAAAFTPPPPWVCGYATRPPNSWPCPTSANASCTMNSTTHSPRRVTRSRDGSSRIKRPVG
jgi:2-polyprenyl-6-methoxyphenol hydroxylase-like FAD-dependent oxidoreductase